jgi:hypothetical protein
MKNREYKEGPKARETFECVMMGLFRVPKSTGERTIKKKPKKGKGYAAF